MAPGDYWFLCRVTEGMHCRGWTQAEWHHRCMSRPVIRNAGLELREVGRDAQDQDRDEHDVGQ
jgi:hypothetical protein